MTAQSCFGMGLDSLTRTCFSPQEVTAFVQVQLMVLSPSLAAVSNMLMKSRNDLFFLKAGHFPLWFDES